VLRKACSRHNKLGGKGPQCYAVCLAETAAPAQPVEQVEPETVKVGKATAAPVSNAAVSNDCRRE
jgi:hypothetical protein